MARRYYGCVWEALKSYPQIIPSIGVDISLAIVERIAPYKIRDWRTNQDSLNRIRAEIDDILFGAADQHGLEITLDDQDRIIDQCVEVAIANED